MIDLAFRRCGRSLAVALALAIAVLLVDRTFGIALPLVAYVGIAAAGGLIGVISAARAAPTPNEVAIEIDRRWRLKDRIGTAVTLAHTRRTSTDPQFAEMVRRDAEGRAARIDPRSTAPIQLRRAWLLVLSLAAIWPTAARLLPARLLPEPAVAAAAEQTVVRAESRRELAETLDRATNDLRERAPSDPVVNEQLDALDELADQLESDPARSVDDIRQESAARMDELADRLADEARRNLDATEQVTRRFDSMGKPETPMSTDELLEAIRRGDLGDAADALDELLEHGSELSGSERQQLAEALRELGRVAETPPVAETDLDEPSARLRQTLRDQGLDEQTVRELMDDPEMTADSLEQSLAERGVDREVASDLARDLETLSREEQLRRETREQAKTIREAMNDAARDLDPTDEPPAIEPSDRSADRSPDGQPQPPRTATPQEQDQTQDQTPGQTQPGQTETPPQGRQPRDDQSQTPQRQPESQPQDQTQGGQAETTPQAEQPRDQTQTPQRQAETPPRDQTQPGQTETPQAQQPRDQTQAPPRQAETPPRDQTQPGQTETPQAQQPRDQSQTPPRQAETPPRDQTQPGQTETPQAQQPRDQSQTPPRQAETPPPAQPRPTGTPQGQDQTQGQPQDQTDGSPDQTPQTGTPQDQDRTQPQPRQDESRDGRSQPAIDPDRAPTGSDAPKVSEPAPDADEPSSPADTLRELARRRSEARDRMRQSETLRDAARRMTEPEGDEQWSNQWARRPDRGGEPGTASIVTPPADPSALTPDELQDLDIAGERGDGETVARWLTDERDPDTATQGDVRRTRIVRDAQRVAERAVNESAVPRRYHRLIRRYFDRLPETVDRAAEPPPP